MRCINLHFTYLLTYNTAHRVGTSYGRRRRIVQPELSGQIGAGAKVSYLRQFKPVCGTVLPQVPNCPARPVQSTVGNRCHVAAVPVQPHLTARASTALLLLHRAFRTSAAS